MESAGQHAQTTIFAANGAARHRIVRAAIVAGFALLAAWAVALALGVMGGFGSLPMLPSAISHGSGGPPSTPAHASAAAAPTAPPTRAIRASRAAVVHTHRGPTAGGRSVAVRRPAPSHPSPSSPAHAQKVTGSQGHAATHVTTSSGNGYGTTRTTLGKPTGSPGNATGGSGAPGRLR